MAEKEEIEEEKGNGKWRWVGFAFKYGSAVIIALVSLYAARQEKAYKALAMLEVTYKEQSAKIVELQNYINNYETEKKAVFDECKAIASVTRQNALFYLMGKRDGSVRAAEAEQVNKNIMDTLTKIAPKVKLEKLPLIQRPVLKSPKSFNSIEQKMN